MMNRLATRKHLLLLLFVAILAISGCAGLPKGEHAKLSTKEILNKAQEAENKGDLGAAAREYLRLAAISSEPQRADYQLHAVAVLLRGNFIAEAKRTLQTIQAEALKDLLMLRYRMLSAKLALAENDPALAIEDLNIKLSAATPADMQAEFHELRADAYLRSGRIIEAADERIKREKFLADPALISANQAALWQSLLLLPDEELQKQAINQTTPYALRGWLELAKIARMSPTETTDADSRIDQWRERFPNHTASEVIINALLARQLEERKRPTSIALLLPLSGPYEKAASVLRDGFLAAHFNRSNQAYQATIRIYDVDGENVDIRKIYNQAVSDGAEFIVGPLNKDTVKTFISNTRISVPTMTLNYPADFSGYNENLFLFGLAPEDEAVQLAERAWLDGHNQAIVLTPEGEWGQRIVDAFSKSWESLGGTILETQNYPSGNNDFSTQLQDLLNINESDARYASLKKLLRQDLKYEPRRREDADFVFLAAFPRQARLIRPQLKFHYAGNLPVYATSHIFTGNQNMIADRDMDDIMFCDIPWVLFGNGQPQLLKKKISQYWPEEADQYLRFYALGIDAYNIIPHLNYMKTFRYERFNGDTGILSLDDNNRIFRQLQWARFRNGVPRPL